MSIEHTIWLSRKSVVALLKRAAGHGGNTSRFLSLPAAAQHRVKRYLAGEFFQAEENQNLLRREEGTLRIEGSGYWTRLAYDSPFCRNRANYLLTT